MDKILQSAALGLSALRNSLARGTMVHSDRSSSTVTTDAIDARREFRGAERHWMANFVLPISMNLMATSSSYSLSWYRRTWPNVPLDRVRWKTSLSRIGSSRGSSGSSMLETVCMLPFAPIRTFPKISPPARSRDHGANEVPHINPHTERKRATGCAACAPWCGMLSAHNNHGTGELEHPGCTGS